MPCDRRSARSVHLPGCRVDLVTREVHRSGAPAVRLTLQEARLLARLAASPGEAVSRQELLAAVWGYHPQSRSRAPDVAVRRLRTKIEADASEPLHVCTVLGHGWVLRGAASEGQRRPPAPDLIGRDALVDAVDRALVDEGRGVCLIGPPGVGKTEVARHVVQGLPMEVVPVPLEGARDEGALLAAVAAALELPVGGVVSLGAHIGAVLEGRDAVLWLDAPEAVVDALQGWLAAWPARALVASRVAVEGLQAVEVPPLSRADAEALFRRLAPEVADPGPLVEGLDGLPLGIRLAAARARQVGLDALVGDHGVRYERVTARGASAGLEDSIARSWALLDPVEREVMTSLSPLVEAFDLATAEAVTPPSDRWVGDVLVDLVRSSLLVRDPGPRYRMLESVRWFSSRQGERPLVVGGPHPPVDRLIDWAVAGNGTWPTLRRLVDLTEARRPERLTELVLAVDEALRDRLPAPARRTLLARGRGLETRRRLAMLAWRLGEHGALERLEAIRAEVTGTALGDQVLVDLAGARRAARVGGDDVAELRAALERTAAPDLRIDLLWELAEQHTDRRAFRDARLALQQAIAIDREGRRRAELLCALGHVALKQDRPAEGLAAVEEAVRLAPGGTLGERGWRTLGGLRYLSGDLDGAAAAWEHARDLARELGLWRQHAVSLGNLGAVHADLGETGEARRLVEEALARSEELGQVQSTVPNLVNLGKIALLDGDAAEAREVLGRAVAIGRAHGWAQPVVEARLALAVADRLEGRDAVDALRDVLAEARAIGADREAALAEAHLAGGDGDGAVGVDGRLLAAARAARLA
jgi:DNA-binding winged helix-turn-helix (wHTH) protein/tetratricopeptide (TPR) repeat protein